MPYTTLTVLFVILLSAVHALVIPPRRTTIYHRAIHGHTRGKAGLLEDLSFISPNLLSNVSGIGDFLVIPRKQVITTSVIPTSSIPAPNTLTSITEATPTHKSSNNSAAPFISSAPPFTATPKASIPLMSTSPVDNGLQKYVVAHHMVGNTYPYTMNDWADDIRLAHVSGIDGFALNCGIDDWSAARVADAYEAAKQSNLDFKLFISLDMTSFPCQSPDDACRLREFIKPYLDHPNQLRYDSRAFVSTFAGETCTFGQASVQEGWKSQFVQRNDLQGKIYFVPAFFIDPAEFGGFSEVMNGDFNWNSGWPIELTTSFAHNLVTSLSDGTGAATVNKTPAILRMSNAILGSTFRSLTSAIPALAPVLDEFIKSTETDDEHVKALEALHATIQPREDRAMKPMYMGAVSPWFFTHYGKDSFNKNWIYFSDHHLYVKRWESIISNRDQFDIIQILTWNDYGESHYIGPVKGSQPNSEAWVNGFDHTGWLELTRYYATAYKTGIFPAIEKDKIFMWSRPHPSQAKADDPVGQPENFELSQDAVWVVVMTTRPSTVILSTSLDAPAGQQIQVPLGVSKLSVPITPGGIMKGIIQREGKTIVELAPSPEAFTFQGSPALYNFNAFVASAIAN